jgi:hypothetical protein
MKIKELIVKLLECDMEADVGDVLFGGYVIADLTDEVYNEVVKRGIIKLMKKRRKERYAKNA